MENTKNKLITNKFSATQTVSSSEIADLQATITSLLQQNKRKILKICRKQPLFSYTPYKPTDPVGIQKVYLKPLMLKQIDNLMDESDILTKKQEEITLKSLENTYVQQTQIQKQANHFMILRSAWTKFSSKDSKMEEHVDNLNKIVGMIKNNIHSLISQQNSSQQCQVSSILSNTSFNNEKLFQKLKEEKERLKMQNEDLKVKIGQLIEILDKKEKKIYELQRVRGEDSQNLRKQQILLTEKECSLMMLESQKVALEERYKGALIELEKFTECQAKTLQFSNENQKLKIVVYSHHLAKQETRKTKKLFHEIDEFFTHKDNSVCNIPDFENIQQSQIVIPELSLPTQNPEKKYGLSDRMHAKNTNKFIPMRTQRKDSNKSQLYKTTAESNEMLDDLPQKVKKFMRTTRIMSTQRKNKSYIFQEKEHNMESL